jgi:hypothetical protein
MTQRTCLLRLLAGGLILAVLVAGLFAITLSAIRWGATDG